MVGVPDRDLGTDLVSVGDFSVVRVSGVSLIVPDEGGDVMLEGFVAEEGSFVSLGDIVEGD